MNPCLICAQPVDAEDVHVAAGEHVAHLSCYTDPEEHVALAAPVVQSLAAAMAEAFVVTVQDVLVDMGLKKEGVTTCVRCDDLIAPTADKVISTVGNLHRACADEIVPADPVPFSIPPVGATCLGCGGEDGPLKIWMDPDGERHWIHERCELVSSRVAFARRSIGSGATDVDATLARHGLTWDQVFPGVARPAPVTNPRAVPCDRCGDTIGGMGRIHVNGETMHWSCHSAPVAPTEGVTPIPPREDPPAGVGRHRPPGCRRCGLAVGESDAAYYLGQLYHPVCVDNLKVTLEDVPFTFPAHAPADDLPESECADASARRRNTP